MINLLRIWLVIGVGVLAIIFGSTPAQAQDIQVPVMLWVNATEKPTEEDGAVNFEIGTQSSIQMSDIKIIYMWNSVGDPSLELELSDGTKISPSHCGDSFCVFRLSPLALPYVSLTFKLKVSDLPQGLSGDYLAICLNNCLWKYTLSDLFVQGEYPDPSAKLELAPMDGAVDNPGCDPGEYCWLRVSINGPELMEYRVENFSTNCDIGGLDYEIDTPPLLFTKYLFPVDMSQIRSFAGCEVSADFLYGDEQYKLILQLDSNSTKMTRQNAEILDHDFRLDIEHDGVVSLLKMDERLVVWSPTELEYLLQAFGLLGESEHISYQEMAFPILAENGEVSTDVISVGHTGYSPLSFCRHFGEYQGSYAECVYLKQLVWEKTGIFFRIVVSPERG